LDQLATGATFVLDNIPVSMFFAVFEAPVESRDANRPAPAGTIDKRYLVYTTGDLPSRPIDSIRIYGLAPAKIRPSRTTVGKVGLRPLFSRVASASRKVA
jgi:hypothetical protein